MRALLLVAHPDDEVIFAGGLMLAHPEVEWDVAIMTYRPGNARGAHALRAMREMRQREVNITTRLLGMADEGTVVPDKQYEQWYAVAEAECPEPDIVFTHNRLGEYGHPHHMVCHRIAHQLYSCPVWDFYCEFSKAVPQERLATVYDVDIASGLKIAKLQVMTNAYRYEYNALAAAMPDLIGTAFGYGPERFTCDDPGLWLP